MKGIYTLVIELEEESDIEVGALGNLVLKKGYYVYVGSAQNGLEARVERHLRDEKKKHWHVDYFLEDAEIVEIYMLDGDKEEECQVAGYLDSSLEAVDGFGSSDCKCKSHLFFSCDIDYIRRLLNQYQGLEKYDLR